ncbi:hypothetical protein BDW59DRAFT_167404 [Aspergillus cavernicola]|uniref:Heterokaryon incompatibility domain-containing protein n=1 Tax=Aspergillus cavernicola TaxID=176166 RepID=A0ABR4HE54_9EURO
MLQTVLDQVAKDTDYLWIDIACIDQDDQGIKMDEVGRQVGIFAGARLMYVWLSHLNPGLLYTNLNDLIDLVSYLYILEAGDPKPAIRRLSECFTFLLEDPWFTSLWTLQESVFNRAAMILSRDGRPVPCRINSGYIFMSVLVNESSILLYQLDRLEEDYPHMIQGVQKEVRTIRFLCKSACFESLYINNPNVQYGLVRYRTTTRPADRIYGIMQIYQLSVGQSAEPWRTFTLDELRDKFAQALAELGASPKTARFLLIYNSLTSLSTPKKKKKEEEEEEEKKVQYATWK